MAHSGDGGADMRKGYHMDRVRRTLSLITALSIALGAGGMVPRADGASHNGALAGKLYFTRAGLLYMSNADGSSAQALTTAGTPKNPDEMPAVTRDGKHVAYVQWQKVSHSQPYGVYVLNPHGKPTPISSKDLFTFDPAWSPDGTQIAYETSVYFYSALYAEIIIRRVADGAAIDLIGNTNAPLSAPTWSPDGRIIVIDQANAQGSSFVEGLEALDIAKMLASGQPKEKIEHALTNDTSHGYNKPSFSPDGRFIACVRTAPKGTDGDLWVMNADGSGGHVVAHDAHFDRPAWSPDGSAIAFTRGHGVAIVSAGTGALLATIPNAKGPAWGGQGKAQAVSPSNTGNPSPSPSPSPTPATAAGSPTGTSAVTITSAGLFRQVGGRYQATQQVSVGQNILYAVYYRTAGIEPSVVTGSLSFVYSGKALGSFPLTVGKAADGMPVLTTHLRFPATKGLKATKMGAQFTVHWKSGTQHKTVWFMLEP
jgi:hypothetical protein